MRTALVLLALGAAPAAGQTPIYERARGATGIEVRTFAFDQGIQLRHATQVALPVSAGIPLRRRLFVDITASYALTSLESYDGASLQMSGFTDTEVRASYTLARDAAVVALGMNLPSGVSQIETSQLAVIRSAGQNFLPFPVSNYGAGLGVSGALALTQRLGAWSLGLAGSARYLGTYTPFSDTIGSYAPGVETRLRLGIMRLLGEQTSLAGGFTFSTYGTDEFTGVPAFVYRPGNRYIGELAVTRQVGQSSFRASTWVYVRSPGDSSGATVERAKERIVHGTLLMERPISGRVDVDGGLEGRSWHSNPPDRGWLLGVRAGARLRLTSVLTVAGAARIETGRIWLDIGDAGLRGLGGSISLVVGS